MSQHRIVRIARIAFETRDCSRLIRHSPVETIRLSDLAHPRDETRMSAAPEPTASLDIALAHASRLLDTDPALAGRAGRGNPAHGARHPIALLLLGASRSARGDAKRRARHPRTAGRRAARFGAHATRTRHRAGPGRPRRRSAGGAAPRGRAQARPARGLARPGRPPHRRPATATARTPPTPSTCAIPAATRRCCRPRAALDENRIPEAEALLREHLQQAAHRRRRDPHAGRTGRAPGPRSTTPSSCSRAASNSRRASTPRARTTRWSCIAATSPREALAEIDTLLARRRRTTRATATSRRWSCAASATTTTAHRALRRHRCDAVPAPAQDLAELRPRAEDRRPPGRRHRRLPPVHRARPGVRRGLVEPGQPQDLPLHRRGPRHDAAPAGAQPNLPDEHRLHLEFALGKALEDAGEYAASFEHYARGNALRRAQVALQRRRHLGARAAHAQALYTREFFAQRAGQRRPARAIRSSSSACRARARPWSSRSCPAISQVEGTMELPEIISHHPRAARRGRQDDRRRSAVPRRAGRRSTPTSCARSASSTSSARASTARPTRRSSSTRCRTTSRTSA